MIAPPSSRLTRLAGWIGVMAVSASLAIGLGTHGRPPAVDLPQHALLVRYWMDHAADGAYRIYPTSPYALYYVLARWLAHVTSPAHAVWILFAIAVASVPLGAAVLASSMRRNPAAGLASMLGLLGACAAWGFSALILGMALLCFTIAAAIAYARRPRPIRGVVLLLLLGLTYTMHVFAFGIAIGTSALVLIGRRGARAFHPRVGWPVGTAIIAAAAAMFTWIGTMVPGTAFQEDLSAPLHGPTASERLEDLSMYAASFGRSGSFVAPWRILALVFLAGAIVAGLQLARRLHRQGARRVWRRRWLWIDKATLPVVALGSVIAFLTMPLLTTGTFIVFPRFWLVFGLLVPALLPRGPRAWWALAAVPVSLWMTARLGPEVQAFADATACTDTLAAKTRPGEAMVYLVCSQKPRGYATPVRLHTAAEIVAQRGGTLGFDFADFGVVIGYGAGWGRTFLPTRESYPHLYDHAKHGAEFTAWLVQGCGTKGMKWIDPATHTVERCGDLTLIYDRTVEPGSRTATTYLPHHVGD